MTLEELMSLSVGEVLKLPVEAIVQLGEEVPVCLTFTVHGVPHVFVAASGEDAMALLQFIRGPVVKEEKN